MPTKSRQKEGNSSSQQRKSDVVKLKFRTKIKLSLIKFLNNLRSHDQIIKKNVNNKSALKKIDPNVTDGEILENFHTFSTKTVEDAMIPRSDIVAVKHDTDFAALAKTVSRTHHTRTIVYEGTLDNIIGFIHIKDLFAINTQHKQFVLKNLIRKPIISAPSMKLKDLLVMMRRQRTHIAVVVDEYGGTDGMVTIEDIIEELIGRIDDEHDNYLESDSYQIIDASTVIASSRVEVEDIEQILGIKLKNEDDEFDTIGGLVLAKVGYMPSLGTKIDISERVELEVIDANPRTLKTVKLRLKEV